MHRIDGPTRAAVLPAPAPAGTGNNGPGYFSKGDPVAGVPATTLDADWANTVQEEIAGVIEHAGGVLDKTNQGQLLVAILALISATSGGSISNPGHLTIGGLTIQWGTTSLGGGANVISGQITFPVAFANACFVVVGNADGPANPNWHPILMLFSGLGVSGCTYTADSANVQYSINAGSNVRWIALGN